MPIAHLTSAQINYLDQGTGKPLVFIHGLGANLKFYQPQIEFFSLTHRVICPELRGNGSSSGLRVPLAKVLDVQCEDVAELLALLGIEKAIFAGTSYGGVFCFNFALRYPEKVSSLIIADSLADARIKNFRDGLLKIGQYLGLWGVFLPKPVLISMVKYFYRPYPLAQKLLADFVRRLRRPEFLLQLMALNRIQYTPYLERISCPTLGIVGEHNKLGMNWMGRAMGRIPRSSLRIIPDSIDPSNLCQPELYNRLVKEFLQEFEAICR